jgi:beta-carotene 3-hydroxylase
MDIVLNVALAAGVACGMEGVAWFLHKYVMHGFLWVLHEDHHRPKHRGLQKNDLFAVFFVPIAMALLYLGLYGSRGMPLFAIGCGVTLYGMGYFLFHDVMFHRRIPGLRIPARGAYLQRIVHAHQEHHRHSGKHDGIAFGFLYASKQYAVAT